jgi:hypothetical protein
MSSNEPISGDTADNCGDKSEIFLGYFQDTTMAEQKIKHILVCLHGKSVQDFHASMKKLRDADYKILNVMKALAPDLHFPCQTRFAYLGARPEIINESCLTIYLMDDNVPQEILQHEWSRTHGHPRLVIKDNATGEKIRTHFWTRILGTPAAAIEFL